MSQEKNKVGYKQPPLASQFQPGRSGNPAGRPSGRRTIDADLRDELLKITQINEGGCKLSITQQQAVVRELVGAALGGDLRAMGLLFDRLGRQVEADADAVEPLAPEDVDIVQNFNERGSDTSNRKDEETPEQESEK